MTTPTLTWYADADGVHRLRSTEQMIAHCVAQIAGLKILMREDHSAFLAERYGQFHLDLASARRAAVRKKFEYCAPLIELPNEAFINEVLRSSKKNIPTYCWFRDIDDVHRLRRDEDDKSQNLAEIDQATPWNWLWKIPFSHVRGKERSLHLAKAAAESAVAELDGEP